MTISAEEVAKRNSVRPGMRLVAYREVGLPFWKMTLRCRFLARKSLSALDEFTLRCVDSELRTSDRVSAFLGIPVRVVDEVMADLVRVGHLVPYRRDSDVRFVVSETGRILLSDMEQILPEEKPVRLAYDGMTRAYGIVAPELQWRPRDLRGGSVLEIPAFPADPPEVSPADTASVAHLVDELPASNDSTLLSVVGLEGKREKFFVKAVALVFESVDAVDDLSVNFLIDGRASPDHDLAFARAEGKRKLGIVGSLSSDRLAVEEVLGQEIVAQRVDVAEVAAIRRATDRAASRLMAVRSRAADDADDSDDSISDGIEAAAAELDQAEAALAQIPVRVLEVHEHPEILHGSLKGAERRLLIVSPWIRAAVVNDGFLSDVRGLLERGVSVSIAYGIGSDNAAKHEDRESERRLSLLSQEFELFDFVRLGDTHAKVLICDERLAVVTSFNWLSFKGDPERPFRDERGTLITVESEVSRLYESYRVRLSAIGTRADVKSV